MSKTWQCGYSVGEINKELFVDSTVDSCTCMTDKYKQSNVNNAQP